MSKNINKLIVKYEDLENHASETFLKIVNFIDKLLKKNNNLNQDKFNNAVETTRFEILKKKEKEEGFDEAVYSNKEGGNKKFFNLGKENNYKKLVKPKNIEIIEKLFNKEMIELGYL
tara:strand:- start:288 stop:638 length:351 start_codon:yes stop_codon:yes gene_type:complete